MKKSTTLLLAGTALVTASAATAGGLDRNALPLSALFESGSYAQLSFGSVRPDVSGVFSPLGSGISTENMAPDYNTFGLAFKTQLNDQVALALFFNQPYGALADYTVGEYTGLSATWESSEIAAIVKYQLNENVSVYGGARALTSSNEITIPAGLFAGGYVGSTEEHTGMGYIVGAAYEIPAIALRGSITYQSAIDHEFVSHEGTPAALDAYTALTDGVADVTMPQSVAIDFQTGINESTLVLASVKWTDWSETVIAPDFYSSPLAADAPLITFEDTTSYSLGAARKINDNLALLASVGYEAASGDGGSRLSPTDGSTSVTLGARYTMDNVTFTGGLQYRWLGDVSIYDSAGLGLPEGTVVQEFADNTAVGIGLSVGFSF